MNTPFDKIKGKLTEAGDFLQAHRRIFSDKMGDDRFIYLNKKKLQSSDPANIGGLKFQQKDLTDDSVDVICEILENAPNIRELSLDTNKFTSKGIERILTVLEDHPHFEKLNISNNPLGNGIAPLLARFMNVSPSIQSISAASVGMDDNGMAELLDAASNSKTVRNLFLSGNAPGEATLSAAHSLIRKNADLTNLSLTANNWAAADGFANAFSSVSHRNLLNLTPASKGVRELMDDNYTVARKINDSLRDGLEGMDFKQLTFVHNRLPSAFNILERANSDVFQQAKDTFNGLIAKMPSMPKKGSDLKAFFQPNEHGFTALDNPTLWQHPDAAERLADLSIRREDLNHKTAFGASLLESLANGMSTAVTVAVLNRQDIKLGAKDLVDSEGAPTSVYQAFIERNDIAPLFTLGNWVGKNPNELRTTLEPLNSYQQKQVPAQSLMQEMRRFSPNQSRGR